MKTRNQLRKIFEEFASNHLQLNTFGYGEEFEQQAVENIIYPLLWVVPTPYQINGVDCLYSYRCIVVDRVRKDESNEIEVESDTDIILKDLISYLYQYARENDLEIVDNFTFNPTYEKWADEVSGWFCDIVIKDFFDYSSCALPIAGEIPSGEFPSTFTYVSPLLKDKSIAIPSPQVGDDIPLFYTHDAIAVRQVNYVVDGTTPSMDFNIYFAPSKNSGTPSTVWDTDITATSEAGSETESFDTINIPANNWVWIKVNAKSGTVDVFASTIFYRKVNN